MEFIVTIQEPEIQVVYVATQGEQGVAGLIWIDAGWTDATDYVVDNALEHNGSSYRAFVAHTSSAATEPGVGVDWETVWKILAEKGEDGLPGTTVHNDTTGKQGGTTDEFFHLTEAQHAGIAAAPTAITALNPVASIGDMEWQKVSITTVTGLAVQEILFNTDIGGGALDFTTYDYKVTGQVQVGANISDGPLWYATEANAAAVVASEYTFGSRWRYTVSIGDSQVAGNFLVFKSVTNVEYIRLTECIFSQGVNGVTRATSRGFMSSNTVNGEARFEATNGRTATTTSPTKLGLYMPDGADMAIGTYLILSRRIKA